MLTFPLDSDLSSIPSLWGRIFVLYVDGWDVAVWKRDHLVVRGVHFHLPVLDPMEAIFPVGEMMAGIFPLQQREHPPQQQHRAPP